MPNYETQKIIDITGADQPIPVVYGLRRIKPLLVWAEVGANVNQLLATYVLSEGPILGIYRIKIDGVYVNFSFNTTTNIGVATSAPYQGYFTFEFLNASASSSSLYTGTYRPVYPKLAMLVVKYTQDDSGYPYSNVPNIEIDLYGRTVVAATNPVGTTATYSTNPADIIYDYLTNPIYGRFLNSATEVDMASFATARALYATNIQYYSGGPSGAAYTMNMVVDTSQTVLDNIKAMLNSCNSKLFWSNGKIVLKVMTPGDTTLTGTSPQIEAQLTTREIFEGIQVNLTTKDIRLNAITATFVDPDQEFVISQEITPANASLRSSFRATDGELLSEDTELEGVTNRYIARHIGESLVRQSRSQDRVLFTATKEIWKLRVGDLIDVTVDYPSYTNKQLRISKMTLRPDDLVDIEAVIHNTEDFLSFVLSGPTTIVGNPLLPGVGGTQTVTTANIGTTPPTSGSPTYGDPGMPTAAPSIPTGSVGTNILTAPTLVYAPYSFDTNTYLGRYIVTPNSISLTNTYSTAGISQIQSLPTVTYQGFTGTLLRDNWLVTFYLQDRTLSTRFRNKKYGYVFKPIGAADNQYRATDVVATTVALDYREYFWDPSGTNLPRRVYFGTTADEGTLSNTMFYQARTANEIVKAYSPTSVLTNYDTTYIEIPVVIFNSSNRAAYTPGIFNRGVASWRQSKYTGYTIKVFEYTTATSSSTTVSSVRVLGTFNFTWDTSALNANATFVNTEKKLWQADHPGINFTTGS